MKRNRIYAKSQQIGLTDYTATVYINKVIEGNKGGEKQEHKDKYIIYGRLLNSNGLPVHNAGPLRRTAATEDEARHKARQLLAVVSGQIPDADVATVERGTLVKGAGNKIDQLALDYLKSPELINPKSGRRGWSEGTARDVLNHWLSHRIGGYILETVVNGEDFAFANRRLAEEMINKVLEHGNSNNDRAQAETTVSQHFAQMQTLYTIMRRDHPEFPEADLTRGLLFGKKIPQEQMKALPERMLRNLYRELEARVNTEPALVICTVLMLDGGLRTAEAAGILLENIVLCGNYTAVYVIHQEDKGGRIDRLKTDDSYRVVILGSWATWMMKQGIATLGEVDREHLLMTGKQLSSKVRSLLRECDPATMERAEEIEQSNPDRDERGRVLVDVGAYVLRRNAASRWLNICGLSHSEVDIMLGHKRKTQKGEVFLANSDDQIRIARKLERYVYHHVHTGNPGASPTEMATEKKINLEPFPIYGLHNTSGCPMRLTFDVVAAEPEETIEVRVRKGTPVHVIPRSVRRRYAGDRVVIGSPEEGD